MNNTNPSENAWADHEWPRIEPQGEIPPVEPMSDTDIPPVAELEPLIDRAARWCESLREAVALAQPSEQGLRLTLQEINTLIDRADSVLPRLERAATAQPTPINPAEVNAMIRDAVTEATSHYDAALQAITAHLDSLTSDMNARLDALTARFEQSLRAHASHAAPAQAAVPPEAVEHSLAAWEEQVGQLITLFRAKADQAMDGLDQIGRERAAALEALCARADSIVNATAGSGAGITEVLDDVIHAVAPWKGLVEGKCSPEISPALATIAEHVKREIAGSTTQTSSAPAPSPVTVIQKPRTVTKLASKPATASTRIAESKASSKAAVLKPSLAKVATRAKRATKAA